MANQGLDRTAYELNEGEKYVPLVQQDGMAEFTIKAVVSGIVLGIIFGAANTYLGLMAGLTISTSIPVAVLTVVVFGGLSFFGRKHTILEANMSQTIGSASSSVASGVLFTIPALFIWQQMPNGVQPEIMQVTLLAMSGGLIGVLFMIPLRRYLIEREHGKLPYPEGLACAEVLVASQSKGSQGVNVFWGLAAGFLIKLATDGLKIFGKVFSVDIGRTALAVKVSPALIGVGYILGPRIATVMVAGAALSAFVLIPIVAWWGQGMETPVYPAVDKPIPKMTPDELHRSYIRYIGAGAVAAAGILTLIRSIPTMIESFRLGVAQIRSQRSGQTSRRTELDLPLTVVFGGVAVVVSLLVLVPGVLGFLDNIFVRAIAAVLIAIFAFFFVTVASRIVGLVGVTSNPTSGMTIATLLGTSFIFYALGWTDMAGKATALMVGTAVCIAASISGDTSQDLKTGFLLGATPRKQQLGELLGVVTSAFFVCATVFALHQSIGIGSDDLPAPQAALMRIVIDGVMEWKLPWVLIFLGVGLALLAALCRVPPLAFAVGVYLPLSTMAAVFLGGLLRYVLTRNQSETVSNQRREQGVLFGSGLVGGEGLMGVGLAMYVLFTGIKAKDIPGIFPGMPNWAVLVSSAVGIVLILLLIAFAARRSQHLTK